MERIFIGIFYALFSSNTWFFAENFREKMAEENRSKELLEIVGKDLKSDLKTMESLKASAIYKIKVCDTFRTYITSDPTKIDQRDFYRVITNYSVFLG